MLEYDIQYKAVISRILSEGRDRLDRTGVGARTVFDVNIRASSQKFSDSRCVLPITTLRKSYYRTAFYELLWMLQGSTDVTALQDKNIHIWDGNSTREFLDSRGLTWAPEFTVPNSYGKQFRNFAAGVDQLHMLVEGLINDPNSRRHLVSLWNPADLNITPLPSCHVMYNFVVLGDTLHLKFYQRSSDWILAGNMNFMFASFFLELMCALTGLKSGSISHSIADCHIYNNLIDVAIELYDREPIDHVATYENPFTEVCSKYDGSSESLDLILDEMFFDDSYYSHIKNTLDYKSHEPIAKERLIMAV